MKNIPLCISFLFIVVCSAMATQTVNKIQMNEDDKPLKNNDNIKYKLISAGNQSSQGYVSNQYIACKTSHVHGSAGCKIMLSSPFSMNYQPQSIQNMIFLRAFLIYADKFPNVSQKGELLVDTIEKNPVWCFEKKESRNLNYKVYLAPLYHQMEPSLKHILKTDLIIFSPYFEKNGKSYILTWNPIDTVQNTIKADKRIILFPFCEEQGTRPGAIISPLLFYNFNGNYVYIAGHIGDYNILAVLAYKIKDEQGKIWVLSWKMVDNKTLQQHVNPIHM